MRLAIVVASVVAAGCGVGAGEFEAGGVLPVVVGAPVPPPWSKVIAGMSRAEVERAVGAPCEVRAKTYDPLEIWVYRGGACAEAEAWCVFMRSNKAERIEPDCEAG